MATYPKYREFPVETNLPPEINQGIGSVMVAHAFLEWRVNCLVYALLNIDHPEGRVALKVQNVPDRFKMIKSLIQLKKLDSKIKLKDLFKDIDDVSTKRDQLAHGLWTRHEDGTLMLTVAKGPHPEAETGPVKRLEYMPVGYGIPPDYYEKLTAKIMVVSAAVIALEKGTKAALSSSPKTAVVP